MPVGLRDAAREHSELRDRLEWIEGYLDVLWKFFVRNGHVTAASASARPTPKECEMGGAVGIAVTLVTIWIWWPYGGFLLGAAIVLGIVDWWSFGVMHNAALRGRGFWDISIRSAEAAPDFATSVNMVASVAQTGLLIWGIIQSDAITWWQALVAVAGLSVLLMFIPTLIIFLPIVALVLVFIRACG